MATTGTALSIRCESFIDAFQRQVAIKQQEIEAMNAAQAEYMACQRALMRIEIPNDGQLKLTSTGARIDINALPTDHSSTFVNLASEIGSELLKARLHSDGEPAVNLSDYWYDISYQFKTKRPNGTRGTVFISVTLPLAGIRDLEVVTTKYMQEVNGYCVKPRDTIFQAPIPQTVIHEPPPSAAFDILF